MRGTFDESVAALGRLGLGGERGAGCMIGWTRVVTRYRVIRVALQLYVYKQFV